MINIVKTLGKYFAEMAWEGTKTGIFVGGIMLACVPVIAGVVWLLDKLGLIEEDTDNED